MENVFLGRIMKQHEAVIIALEKLGGTALLGDLNLETMKIKDCEWKTKTPFASIRRIVQTNVNKIVDENTPLLTAMPTNKPGILKNILDAKENPNLKPKRNRQNSPNGLDGINLHDF